MHVPLIVFISDFGLQDAYVGVVKGVIFGISPHTHVIDLSHEIPLGDIRRAAVVLWQSEPFFPSGTIYLGVVDPGVGTPRRAIICKTANGTYVGPDNGLASYLWMGMETETWEITQTQHIRTFSSNTFHGRDLFGPVAAQIANGAACESFGRRIEHRVTLDLPRLDVEENGIYGEIIYPDRFGNVITSIGRLIKSSESDKWKLIGWKTGFSEILVELTKARLKINANIEIPFTDTFANVPPGSIRALVGSSGLIEIVSNRASTASALNLNPGDKIILTLHE